MKKTFSVLALILFCNNLFAQYMLLDLKQNDCVSCRSNLFFLNKLSSEIPVFAIFSERQRADSFDLEYKFTLNDFGIKCIFNDNLYQKLHKQNEISNWYIFDQNEKIVLEGGLKTINETEIMDFIHNNTLLLPTTKHANYNFTENKVVFINIDLDKIQVWQKSNPNEVINISPSNFDYQFIQTSLKGIDSIGFAEKGEYINKHSKGFRPGFKWFGINTKGEIYALLEYLQTHVQNDTITFNIHSCIVMYDSLVQIKQVYPFNLDSVQNYDNYSARFTLKNDNSFIAITHEKLNWFDTQLEANPEKIIKFITEFTLDTIDRTAKPIKMYSVDLPLIYRKKYFENFLSPELCSFPYITFTYSNKIIDLNTLKTINVIDTLTYNANVDLIGTDLGKEKYKVLSLKYIPKTRELLVVYRIRKNIYIKGFKDFEETRQACIGEILNGNTVHNCFIDPYSEQIYFNFENEAAAIVLPLMLYGF
ncbi:MAG: hypothetical protein H6550_04135 [Chitinophagales bacterium]|nr:hypothetical protein [Chitinophagales bacterium]